MSRMRVYQLARDLSDSSWQDAERLKKHRVTEKLAAQLFTAVGSIVANIGEGYSRSSGRERARFFEYSLGSVRESMAWYQASKHVLGEAITNERLDTLEQVRRLLLAIIPRERDRLIRPLDHKDPRRDPG